MTVYTYNLNLLLLFSRSVMTEWIAASQASLSFTISWSLLRLKSIELMMLPNHLILVLLCSIFPSIRVFSSELAFHIGWPKFWSFSISPFNEYSGLISHRIDWFDLFAVQGTLKSFSSTTVQRINSLAFFMVQLSHPYMTTGKTITLTRQTFSGNVTSLLFNTLSRFVTAFLPRSVF